MVDPDATGSEPRRHGDEDPDAVSIVRVRSEIDMSNVGQFAQLLRDASTRASGAVIVDFTRARFMDSSGLRALFVFGGELLRAGRSIVLVVPPEAPLRRLLEIAGIEALGRVTSTVDEAIAAAR